MLMLNLPYYFGCCSLFLTGQGDLDESFFAGINIVPLGKASCQERSRLFQGLTLEQISAYFFLRPSTERLFSFLGFSGRLRYDLFSSGSQGLRPKERRKFFFICRGA